MRLSRFAWPAAALILCAVVAATDAPAAGALASRLAPVLVFAAGMSAMVNLAARAGVFDYLAFLIEARRFVWSTFLILCVLVTVFLSLDTTVLMLTPLAVSIARRKGLSTTGLALSVVWVAHLASLPLPVSNLTNLLALRFFDGTYDFVAESWAPAVAGIGVALGASYCARTLWPARAPEGDAPEPARPTAALAVLAVTVVALLSPIPFWLTSLASAFSMALATRPSVAPARLIPWQALCLVVAVSSATALLPDVHYGVPPALAGAVAANLINNLPAYMVLEDGVLEDGRDPLALLVGVNFGPLVSPWGSLATLLWHDQLRRSGAELPWRTFVSCGLLLSPVAVGAGMHAIRI